jgi:FkbM family methyltransferase
MVPLAAERVVRNLRGRFLDPFSTRSYAQEGEDLILRRIFDERRDGFFIDVGAHHPKRFSNTYIFYKAGWSGINIEPSPVAQRLFAAIRPRDTNVQLGIAEQSSQLVYYEFNDPALNTFDEQLMRWRLANTPYKVLRQSLVPVERLDVVLARHLPKGQNIDFLTVDVEGMDLEVLRSNDWTVFRPECVLIESLQSSLESAVRGDACAFLQSKGYVLFAKTFNSLFFRLREVA